jgi:hypothetical protein
VSASVDVANAFAESLVDPWPVNAIVPAAFVLRAVRFPAIAEPVRLKTAAAAALPELRVAPCPTKLKFAAALDDPEPLKPSEPDPNVLTDVRAIAEPLNVNAPDVAALTELPTVPSPVNASVPADDIALLELRVAACPVKTKLVVTEDDPATLDDPAPLKPRDADPNILPDERVIPEPLKVNAPDVAALTELPTVPSPVNASVPADDIALLELDNPAPVNASVPAALAFAAMTLVAAPDPVMAKKPPPCARAEGAVVPLPVNDKSPPADALTGDVAAPPPVKDSVAAVSVFPRVEAPADPVKLIDGAAETTAKEIPKNRLDVSEPAKVANFGRTSEETRPRAKPPRAAAPIERQRSAIILSAYDRRR